MKPHTYLRALQRAGSLRRLLDPLPSFSSETGSKTGAIDLCRRLLALALMLLLLPMGQGELFAQDFPAPQQSWPQNGQYGGQQYDQQSPGQYAPAQPPGYGQQPGYAQPQPYPQSYGQPPYPAGGQPMYPPQQGYGAAQPLNEQQMEQLVAPIALYPDALLGDVLAASTYPQQVEEAYGWRQALGYASPEQIAAGAGVQPWDPSVKALTAFPQVLAGLARNLQWTAALGNAYYNQPQDLMETVQALRQRAQAAGNLQDTPQETIGYDQGNIEIVPENPQVVYVPAYNPWAVYGAPVAPYPGFSLMGAIGSFLGPAVQFGLGVAMTAFSHTGWGLLGWGLNWLTQSVLFNHSNYYSHSTSVADWGLPHGGLRAGSEGRGFARAANGYSSNFGSSGRMRTEYNGAARQESGERFVRPAEMTGRTWRGEDTGSGYRQNYGSGYARQGQQFYSRAPQQAAREPYSRSPYASSYSRGYSTGYGGRTSAYYGAQQQATSRPQAYAGYGSSFYGGYGQRGESRSYYSGSQQTYRTPESGFARNGFGENRSESHSLFGGRRSAESFYGGGHAPKSFHSGKMKSFDGGHSGGFHLFGGGHSHGGGHSSGHGGKHHH